MLLNFNEIIQLDLTYEYNEITNWQNHNIFISTNTFKVENVPCYVLLIVKML